MSKRLRGFFVTGTDTNVGKTAVCAGLMRLLNPRFPTTYWKPAQTGYPADDDTRTVAHFTELPATLFEEPVYRFEQPLSPHLAAAKEGKKMEVEALVQGWARLSSRSERAIVEGAGGLLAPFRPGYLQVHWIQELRLPVLIVVEDKLGAINHTLLTIESCRKRQIPVAGVILNQATDFEGNGESISNYGNVRIVARYPKHPSVSDLISQMEKDESLLSALNSYL